MVTKIKFLDLEIGKLYFFNFKGDRQGTSLKFIEYNQELNYLILENPKYRKRKRLPLTDIENIEDLRDENG